MFLIDRNIGDLRVFQCVLYYKYIVIDECVRLNFFFLKLETHTLRECYNT